jgi:hypothetical protein
VSVHDIDGTFQEINGERREEFRYLVAGPGTPAKAWRWGDPPGEFETAP